ncbi:MAG TPA: NAD(P)/FAD-dependent oxidoreductase [Mycobacteriales bacterium]|nr:NAD(P)/FAD-dependent oxidoreductase [Mycobacteriales bacterium]
MPEWLVDVDVVVIGAGPAGENAAGRAADHGLRVAIVEQELIGGECSYWGCIPSKTLLRPGDVLAAARRVPGAAEAVTGSVDVAAALAQRDYMTSSWDDAGQVPWLEGKDVALHRGVGRLTGEREVTVTRVDGPATVLRAEKAVVLACGTVPFVPPVPGLAETRYWDNRDVTALKEVPRRLVVMGGGAVGLEMAQALRRLGSEEVTVVESGPALLGREEPFCGAEVLESFAAEGIEVLLATRVTGVQRDGAVTCTLGTGGSVEADELLVAVGRRPRTADLGLDFVGLQAGASVEVDDQLRAVGVPGEWLYAVGDVNGRALLTHMGKYQARIAADVIAGIDSRDRSSRDVVPRIVFTDPQVCAVGLTEAQVRERFSAVRTATVGTGDVAGATTSGNGIKGTSKLVVDGDRDVVVGATFTGPGTAELLHAATIAIAGAVPLPTLWHAVPSFPTVSEVWLRLMEELGVR